MSITYFTSLSGNSLQEILSIYMLEDLEHLQDNVNEMIRILKNYGYVILSVLPYHGFA
jgi:hypothetical protein